MAELYIKYEGDHLVAYAYGEEWVAQALYMDDIGYASPEEAKLAWIMQNVPGVAERARKGEICVGTIDSWLVYNLSLDHRHCTDYSNASRTQLFNLTTLQWDPDMLEIFGIDPSCMAKLTDSDGDYGMTDFCGWLEKPIPIRGVLGDSHGALFGQGCLEPGMTKTTYGTGSSVMMNIGEKPVFSDSGVVTSLAWKIGGKVNNVLEGKPPGTQSIRAGRRRLRE